MMEYILFKRFKLFDIRTSPSSKQQATGSSSTSSKDDREILRELAVYYNKDLKSQAEAHRNARA